MFQFIFWICFEYWFWIREPVVKNPNPALTVYLTPWLRWKLRYCQSGCTTVTEIELLQKQIMRELAVASLAPQWKPSYWLQLCGTALTFITVCERTEFCQRRKGRINSYSEGTVDGKKVSHNYFSWIMYHNTALNRPLSNNYCLMYNDNAAS